MAILEELKAKANGAADQANNIQEAISMMEFGGGSDSTPFIVDANAGDMNEETGTIVTQVRWKDIHDAFKAYKRIIIRLIHPSNDVMALAEVVGGEVISLSSNIPPRLYAYYGNTRSWTALFPADASDENSYAVFGMSTTEDPY